MCRSPRCGAWLVLVALVLCTGCGEPKSTLTGKVYCKSLKTGASTLLKGGRITFHSERGTVPVEIQEDGSYTAHKVPAGLVKVPVETKHLKPGTTPGYKPPPGMTMPGGNVQDQEAMARRYVPIFDDKYKDPATTLLSHTVPAKNETKDFTVEGP